MSDMTGDPGDLGGFRFDMLGADKPRAPKLSELIKVLGGAVSTPNQLFEIEPGGSVKIHGYDVDDALKLLNGYKDYMIEFGQGMQGLQAAADAVHYTPGEGGYS